MPRGIGWKPTDVVVVLGGAVVVIVQIAPDMPEVG